MIGGQFCCTFSATAEAMVPDVQQLLRVRALASSAGLSLRAEDAEEFVRNYQPVRYRQFVLPPSFVWLCTLCEPAQLARIWVVTALGDSSPLQRMNDELLREQVKWPDELVRFAFTGDELFCFAYESPESQPPVVTAGSSPPLDEDGEPRVDWTWHSDNFEKWFAVQAEWLPKADARMAAWNAEFDARHGRSRVRNKPRH
ncbi:MAG TPA: hypothetical protein VFB66_06855 [Tepidisphaeraceae bacterium]|nr:hypothetical protein [Tepidisphaeraceae bacterium]